MREVLGGQDGLSGTLLVVVVVVGLHLCVLAPTCIFLIHMHTHTHLTEVTSQLRRVFWAQLSTVTHI